MIYEVLLVAYLIVALLLIGFVLIQQGKGADMGASFGSGGSNTVFGSSGSGNFMTRTTAILAGLFFLISLTLGAITANKESAEDEWQDLDIPVSVEIPVQQVPGDQDVPVVDSTDASNQSVDDVPQQAVSQEQEDVPQTESVDPDSSEVPN